MLSILVASRLSDLLVWQLDIAEILPLHIWDASIIFLVADENNATLDCQYRYLMLSLIASLEILEAPSVLFFYNFPFFFHFSCVSPLFDFSM